LLIVEPPKIETSERPLLAALDFSSFLGA